MALVRLKAGRRRHPAHPWIYRTEVDAVEGLQAPGDTVDVLDHRGRLVGRGFCNPRSMLTVRLLSREAEPIDEAFFRRRLERALALRERLLPPGSPARLVFGEADGLPGLIVDRFSDVLVVQTLALGIERHKSLLVDLLAQLARPSAVLERNDAPVRELEGLDQRKGPLLGDPPLRVMIEEHGCRLWVDLWEGQKTGYFLDQRENRAAIAPYVSGARVLDAFCYTGSFAVHAARFGAREVLAVDSSAAALELARENAGANPGGDRIAFVEANAFDLLRSLDRDGERFDVVILDPPAFARGKSTLPGARRGYKEINLRALRLLEPGGVLVTCSCSSPLEPDAFAEVVADAAADAGREVRVLEFRGQARDHPVLLGYPESRYLKCIIARVD